MATQDQNALDGVSALQFVTEQVTPCLLGINSKAGSRRPVREARAVMFWAQPVPVVSNGPITGHGSSLSQNGSTLGKRISERARKAREWKRK